MASIVGNRVYNDPALGAAFSNLAQMFAPPSGADLSGYAAAAAAKEKAARLSELFNYAKDPNFDQARFDRMNVAGGNYAPSQSYYSVDLGDATTRRGQDVVAATSRANNANTVQGSVLGQLYGPLNPGQVRPAVPADVASLVGMPAITEAAGTPKPLSETEWKAAQGQRLLDEGKLSDDGLMSTIFSGNFGDTVMLGRD